MIEKINEVLSTIEWYDNTAKKIVSLEFECDDLSRDLGMFLTVIFITDENIQDYFRFEVMLKDNCITFYYGGYTKVYMSIEEWTKYFPEFNLEDYKLVNSKPEGN
jgi:hypothetical protein